MPIRILVVDRRAIMRAGIQTYCDQSEDLEFVGQASELDRGLVMVDDSQPDVVVLDRSMIQSDISVVLERCQKRNEEEPVHLLLLSSSDSTEDAARLTRAGASGYLTCEASLEEMAMAIRCVAMGRVFISHAQSAMPAPHFAPQQSAVVASSGVSRTSSTEVDLSDREREVLLMVADGMTNKQVAAKLFLSVKTVETYRSRVMKKHGLADRMDLIRFARDRIGTQPLSV